MLRHQLPGQGAGHLVPQAEDQSGLSQLPGLLAAPGVQPGDHLLAQLGLARRIGGTLLCAVVLVDLQLDGQAADGPRLDGLDKAGVLPQGEGRQGKKHRLGPEALRLVEGRQFEVRVAHRLEAGFFHCLGPHGGKPVRRQDGAVDRLGQPVLLAAVGGRPRLRFQRRQGAGQLLCAGPEYDLPGPGLTLIEMFQDHCAVPPFTA